METKKFENGMVDALDQATLNEVQATIESMAAERGWRVPTLPKVGPKKSGGRLDAFTSTVSEVFNGVVLRIPDDISLGKSKHLRRLAARVLQKPNMRNANLYLHFLYGTVLGQESTPRVKYSEKEEAIKKTRKAWKEVQEQADALHLAYKVEKGSYFKDKLLLQTAK